MRARRPSSVAGRSTFDEFLVYWPLVFAMSLCEVFVNFKAFETVFSSEATITALMASAVLAIVLVFAAHSIGGAVQQKKNIGWAILLACLASA